MEQVELAVLLSAVELEEQVCMIAEDNTHLAEYSCKWRLILV